MIENQRIATLLVPLLCLLVCYWVLRTMRGDIMACPERYLDERQKMLREQAHGSAYKLLKRACLLLPLGLLLYTMYWHAPASVSPPPVQSVMYSLADTSQKSVLNELRVNYIQLPAEPAQTLQSAESIATSSPDGDFRISVGMASFPRTPIQLYEQPESFQWLNSPVSMGTFFGTLLLSLFLMITALPMAILAWEGRE